MKNFIQDGNVLTVAAPTGGVSSGDVVNIGVLLGVAAFDAVEAAEVEVKVEGVFEVPKLSTDVVAAGDRLYWDAGNSEMGLDSGGTANYPQAGFATAAAGNGAAVVRIRLTPGAA